MQDVLRISLLLDFYGQLLTRRQHDIMDLHYNGDYSLGEIANHLNITRQGVYDNIKKARDILEEFERKLGLLNMHLSLENEAREMVEKLAEIIERIEDIEIKNDLQAIQGKLKSLAGIMHEA